ncbi:MAG: hypothetical protein AMXMBFR13_33370 [Phycisphaerae bacterium]
MEDPKPPRLSNRGIVRLAGMGVELAASVGVFCVIGYWIDRHMENDKPWALVICAALGVIGGLYNLIRRAVHESLGIRDRPRRRDDRRPAAPGEGPPGAGET